MNTTPLPPLYARWIDVLVGGELEPETEANCAACPMCAVDGDLDDEDRFLPETRCCTFMPDLPSFLVGSLLADAGAEVAAARAAVLRRIEIGAGATPLGLSAPRGYAERYEQRRLQHFGQDASLACPYLAVGACGLWRHRNATCSTFFCRHVHAARGRRFWHRVRSLLQHVEATLLSWCVLELDGGGTWSTEQLFDAGGSPLRVRHGELRGWMEPDGRLEPGFLDQIWGAWRGREAEFYLRCAELVRDLAWSDVRQLAGVRLRILERRLLHARSSCLDDTVPALLFPGLVERWSHGALVDLRSVDTGMQPLLIPAAVYEALELFDGRPTAEVVRVARDQRGVLLTPQLLRTLVYHDVLVPPDGLDVPPPLRPVGLLGRRDRLALFHGFCSQPIYSRTEPGPEGVDQLIIQNGPHEVVFDEQDLLEFGRQLVAHANGFRAEEALRWTAAGVELSWDRVRELLEALLESNVLQRLPPVDRAR